MANSFWQTIFCTNFIQKKNLYGFTTKPTCLFQNLESDIPKSSFLYKTIFASSHKLHLCYKTDKWFTADSIISTPKLHLHKDYICVTTWQMISCRMLKYLHKNYCCNTKLASDSLQKAEISAQQLHLYYKIEKWFTAKSKKLHKNYSCTQTTSVV